MSEESWDGNDGILSVYVSKAKDLPNLNKLDKQNVFLRLRIAHMTRVSDIVFRAGQTPVFDHLENFEITPSVKPLMYVEVYCDRKKKAPLPIGRCEVDLLNGIRADPKEGYCTWYDLKRGNNEFGGTIFIELTYNQAIQQYGRSKNDKLMESRDHIIAARPIPPLPTGSGHIDDSYDYGNEFTTSVGSHHSQHNTNVQDGYMHASRIREFTPNLSSSSHDSRDIFSSSERSGVPNFMSSVGTNGTTSSHATNSSTGSTSSDTKFHFANLKKLKEKINVFKNPTNSYYKSGEEDNGVDIEALQKAIGVASLSDSDSDDSSINQIQGGTRISTMSSQYHNGENDNRGPLNLPTLPKDRISRVSTGVSGFHNNNMHSDSRHNNHRQNIDYSDNSSLRSGSPVRQHSPSRLHSPMRNYTRDRYQSPERIGSPERILPSGRHDSPVRMSSPALPPLPSTSLRHESPSPTRRPPPGTY
ncbi:hypothetical protein Kpol_505p33 [Vanderwaltozyma polyspora DSM 70294]|uniref:C2 domain-containing protein n=1 Tax=Vanderwaltozyma polyspora (strain ATCC 22028 / DSM 70294 / BCRC 21397 / CBS 2163 / NBRC 10782 / NRRL Y-8283 / UCD 57-17) TaxID=436907 RepID=A7TNC4_VANPO|nr:uncharacterized protein Kpol_505p33 [Vanderwaltozyma polyspora DSM 70294]EDO16256.1 hypothetical protein Kpol_505p33 [Vanderwaltozyma polyspora DSM 70294]